MNKISDANFLRKIAFRLWYQEDKIRTMDIADRLEKFELELAILKNKQEREMCKCGKNPVAPAHPCPYDTEINGAHPDDINHWCTCCPDCEEECCRDI
jgi:hypothetical protein